VEVIELQGPLVRDRVFETLEQLKSVPPAGDVEVDLSEVPRIDSAGVALLSQLARQLREQGRQLHLSHPNAAVADTLRLFPSVEPHSVSRPRAGPLETLGNRTLGARSWALFTASIYADTFIFSLKALLHPRRVRWGEVVHQMATIGSQALGVVGLISFLLGATLALQSAAQLRQFGANLYVVDLAAISITREIGPLMAAIIVTGRSGSAICAEIGTMMVTEEIDALRTMGIRPLRYLVVPKFLAMTFTQPLLTTFANVFGILGAFVVATTALELAPVPFFMRLEQALLAKDLVTGLIKSVVFSHLLLVIAVATGFSTRGGPDAVGRSTTTSVVAGIVAIIAADALTSLVFYV
jgi:phospholipid/cholesterol/gamma-HCH transport system permease protein